MSRLGSLGHGIFWGAVIWLFLAALFALEFWPHLPESTSEWVAIIVVGPPLYVLAEGAAEWLWSTRTGRAIAHHPSSAVRIFWGVVIALVVGGAVWGGFRLINWA